MGHTSRSPKQHVGWPEGKIDSDYGSFSELIHWGKTHQVPRYQRKYAWRPTHEVAQLWQDIRQLSVTSGSDEKIDGHFIGPVVIGAVPPKALASVLCPVIVGQQRLITLSLIIAALRDVLCADLERANEITLTCLGKTDDLRVMPGGSGEINCRAGVWLQQLAPISYAFMSAPSVPRRGAAGGCHGPPAW